MILSYDQVKGITKGAARVIEKDGWLWFSRFTEGQERAHADDEVVSFRSQSTAGVRFAFETEATKLSFRYRNLPGSGRLNFGIDLWINGALVRQTSMATDVFTEGKMEFALGNGKKRVEVYFPWSRRLDVCDVELNCEEAPTPLNRRHTLIAYGDSITHGYDASQPSASYTERLARMLDADLINKGIAGDKFNVRMLNEPEEDAPDYITVAYGTNDWCHHTAEVVEEACRAFYRGLSEKYPTSRIYAITPIWRSNSERDTTPYGAPLSCLRQRIHTYCEGLENVCVVDAESFVPHLSAYFEDRTLHPNDAGFAHYAEGLYAAIARDLIEAK